MKKRYVLMNTIVFLLALTGFSFLPASGQEGGAVKAKGASDGGAEYQVPEAYKEQWENIQNMLTDEYRTCIEHCSNEQECVDKCRRTFETRRAKEYHKVLYKDVQDHASCPLCGMNRAKFAHSRVYIEYDDGSAVGTCSLHCAVIDKGKKQGKTPKTFWVGDYNSKKLTDAHKASWVIGGKEPGVMTQRAKWAFANKADADAFVREHGGKVASFSDAVRAAREDMDKDSEMIREKRKMKAGASGPVMPSKDDKCPVCGMFVYKYPKWVGEIIFNDGATAFFDGAKDLFKFYFNIKKFHPGKSTRDIKAIYVTEYYSTALVKADEVFYVVGSDVYGPMGVELIPVKTREDAEQFMKDHKGRRILEFKDITPKVIETLPPH